MDAFGVVARAIEAQPSSGTIDRIELRRQRIADQLVFNFAPLTGERHVDRDRPKLLKGAPTMLPVTSSSVVVGSNTTSRWMKSMDSRLSEPLPKTFIGTHPGYCPVPAGTNVLPVYHWARHTVCPVVGCTTASSAADIRALSMAIELLRRSATLREYDTSQL